MRGECVNGESWISVSEKNRDWEGLRRKLRAGKLVEDAAVEAGIPIDEARKWLEDRRPNADYDDDSLRLLASSALNAGIAALVEAAKETAGRMSAEGGGMGASYKYFDVDAAKALVNAGLKIRTMVGAKRKAAASARDLFDAASGDAERKLGWDFPDGDD